MDRESRDVSDARIKVFYASRPVFFQPTVPSLKSEAENIIFLFVSIQQRSQYSEYIVNFMFFVAVASAAPGFQSQTYDCFFCPIK